MVDSSRIVIAAGARAAELRLLAEIEGALPPGEVASPPVVVIVPSSGLRTHLLARLTALRPAWLGLEVKTLAALTASILGRGGAAPRSGERLESILAIRLAARESALARSLGGLADGYRTVGGAVRDLLDAGFVEEHLDAIEERLELERASVGSAAVERACAIARVASGVRRELARLGLMSGSERLAEAARRLEADPASAVSARAVFLHGFTDATGVGSDLLAALVRHRPTVTIFDAPLDLDGGAATWRFGTRLRERLAGVAPEERDAGGSSPAEISVFRAADGAREARSAVAWLRASGENGPSEASALISRDLGDVPTWALELDRQAVAGSAESGLPLPHARRAAALLELLARGDESPLSLVLELGASALAGGAGASVHDLRLAFASANVRTLGAACDLRPSSSPLRLPVAERLGAGEAGEGRMLRREVDGAALVAACGRLRAVRAALAGMARRQAVERHLSALRALLRQLLSDQELAALEELLAVLADPALAAFEVDAVEWRQLLAETWDALPTQPIGGGGGAALLSVTEARGRTFDRLALCGLSRDRFPRTIRPDPLLPDALRLRLRELLPDLPVKGEGHDEERFLFAQLLGAAERLALFRPHTDGEARTLAASPLVDELRRTRRLEEVPAPAPASPTPVERAIAAALAGDRGALARSLTSAVTDARDRFGDGGEPPAERVAATRLALLDERSADPAGPAGARLGSFLGLVGAPGVLDPRRRSPSVTALERLAGCGWQMFLERVLRLEPLPQIVDGLPTLSRATVGRVVHAVLEGLGPGPRSLKLSEAVDREPATVAWPPADELERRAHLAAREALDEEAIDPSLFERLLVREAMAHLEVARLTDWADGARDLLAVEVDGETSFEAAGAERRIPFRADRLERIDGVLWLTDYKTGKPLISVVRPEKRSEHLARKIASGEALQLPAYLLALPAAAARARYLSLDPRDLDERLREAALNHDELDRTAVAAALDTLFGVWDAGAFVPRLLDEKLQTYPGCKFCDVRDACVQGDSGARQRFERWARSSPETDRPFERPARAWLELRGPIRPADEESA